jgi:hypothetical protein
MIATGERPDAGTHPERACTTLHGLLGYSREADMHHVSRVGVIRVGAAGLAVAFLAAGCGEEPQPAGAPPTGAGATPATGPGGALQEPPVTAQEAQTAALEAVGGGWILETTIEERDDDRDDDRDDGPDWDGDDDFEADVDVWEVTVVGPDGLRHLVSVDLTGGSVLDSRVDD